MLELISVMVSRSYVEDKPKVTFKQYRNLSTTKGNIEKKKRKKKKQILTRPQETHFPGADCRSLIPTIQSLYGGLSHVVVAPFIKFVQ